tara:strand:- start:132 stop:515 length:384 start_codon:yes stop_codon:yes gene_type:complete
MENSKLKKRIVGEINKVISASCVEEKTTEKFKDLHTAILKRYYNAVDVKIDYHRKRVVMDIIIDETQYDSKNINTYLQTFKANIIFRNLKDFLKSCIEKDDRSTAYYARLLQALKCKDKEQNKLTIV